MADTDTMQIRELVTARQPEIRDLSITVAGDRACCQSLQRLSAPTAGVSVQLWLRSMITLQRSAGTWLVVAERQATPFYMDVPVLG